MMSSIVKGCSEQWVGQWNLPEAQARGLYLALATLVKVREVPSFRAWEGGLCGLWFVVWDWDWETAHFAHRRPTVLTAPSLLTLSARFPGRSTPLMRKFHKPYLHCMIPALPDDFNLYSEAQGGEGRRTLHTHARTNAHL